MGIRTKPQQIKKLVVARATLTGGGTVQTVGSPFDLGLDRKYSYAIATYVGVAAGTAGTKDVRMTVTTGATSATADAFIAKQAAGTTLGTGHLAAGATGSIFRDVEIDLTNVLCNRWIKVTVDADLTASDTLIGEVILTLYAARNVPVSTLGTNAMDTT